MKKVLIIEDNRQVAGILCDFCESQHIEADYADNGELGLELAKQTDFDVIILDLMLPRMNGFEVCERLRQAGIATPVLMLTALDGKEDMLKGFSQGADDYLAKPFDLDILLVRLQALYKRYRGSVALTQLQFGELTIYTKERRAFRGQYKLPLNPTTYKILELLCQCAPNVVSKQTIIDTLWPDDEAETSALRSHIYQLRNALDKPFEHAMLVTVPKVGFRLEKQS
ncbi:MULTISPECIES: response regulator transcription factor [unclassified Vibrio]|uniref:Response regulator transcription factor n=1 Tax=Vibrio sp. HB236076 TaxID=3232307 RepID=A0AB39HIH2_9VIBR|nr:response regulator transcription factor [Vibrio sp. HB161653]MDP5253159.1 response regulator transcription factor [Vibrio sp. HB161653]